MTDIFKRVRDVVFRNRQAYRQVFQPGGVSTVAGQIVLADLARFCRAHRTPAVVSPITQSMDPMATGIAIGRQEVWHRIAQHLYLSDADLYKLVEAMEQSGTE